ncbi:ATP-binding cassette domain-containing protein [Variovorax sp. OV329]|uniref:ABC transporter ATP-binding protein n=1 Tax=Variovorax sp. OV329 TaxID=1882825 RepID=UPI0008E98D9E|nr:ATP-binding cassette domain-containing protein [Variovorax sp. OV329]SFN05501.1 ABC transporter [Variovorax sp. OV329]
MNPSASASILVVDDLSFAYPGQPPIASRWSASIGAGVSLLYGDDGSGKSTILRMLAANQPAGGGRLTLAGARLDAEPDVYKRKVFFVDPETDAFDAVTAVECASTLKAGDARFSEASWQALVDGFALAPHLGKQMHMLSTGSRRKVWLAAALASGRPLTLLDEPTAALDSASIRFLWRALAEIAEERTRAIVIASAARIDSVPLSGSLELPLRST